MRGCQEKNRNALFYQSKRLILLTTTDQVYFDLISSEEAPMIFMEDWP